VSSGPEAEPCLTILPRPAEETEWARPGGKGE